MVVNNFRKIVHYHRWIQEPGIVLTLLYGANLSYRQQLVRLNLSYNISRCYAIVKAIPCSVNKFLCWIQIAFAETVVSFQLPVEVHGIIRL